MFIDKLIGLSICTGSNGKKLEFTMHFPEPEYDYRLISEKREIFVKIL